MMSKWFIKVTCLLFKTKQTNLVFSTVFPNITFWDIIAWLFPFSVVTARLMKGFSKGFFGLFHRFSESNKPIQQIFRTYIFVQT